MEPLSDGTPKKEKTKKKRKFTNSNDSHDIYICQKIHGSNIPTPQLKLKKIGLF